MRDLNGDKAQDYYNEADLVRMTTELTEEMLPKNKKAISPYKALLWTFVGVSVVAVICYIIAHTNLI